MNICGPSITFTTRSRYFLIGIKGIKNIKKGDVLVRIVILHRILQIGRQIPTMEPKNVSECSY